MINSRVPPIPGADRALLQFLDRLDRFMLAVSEIQDADTGTATTATNAAKINEILTASRRR